MNTLQKELELSKVITLIGKGNYEVAIIVPPPDKEMWVYCLHDKAKDLYSVFDTLDEAITHFDTL